jgi:hypothetical protein
LEDRDGARAEITNCIVTAQLLAQSDLSALGDKGAVRVQKQFATVIKRLMAGQTALDNSAKVTDAKALNALIKASTQIAKAQKSFIKFKTEAPFVVLEELRGRGGFRGPNQLVCYRIHVLDLSKGANCGPGTISMSNLPDFVGLNVVQDAVIIKNATDFCVITGDVEGAARITATACDRSSSLILINVGPPP